MPSFLRDVLVRNVVIDEKAIQDLHAAVLQRVAAHNEATQDDDRKLTPIYIVRFDSRGYRTFSADEAWDFYMGANVVERVILQAESIVGLRSNHMLGEQIEIRLDADRNANSHVIVGGDSKDWVEATFASLESILKRRKDTATAIVRTPWTALLVQLLGVVIGILMCLWLSILSAPYLKGVEYPRAVSFAFWFLVYSNLWTYIQQRALSGIDTMFPNVRLSRSGEHWTQKLLRKAMEAGGIAVFLWLFAWLTKWATSVIAPFLTSST